MENRLTLEEIKIIKKIHDNTKSKIDSDKLKCLMYWGKGWSWKQIKEALFISDGTIKSYIDKYKEGGVDNLLTTHYEGHNRKLSENQELSLVEYIVKNNIHNTKQVCKYVKDTFGIKYTINGMKKMLDRLGFVYNKPENLSHPVDSYLQGIHLGLNYIYKILSLDKDEEIYFIYTDIIYKTKDNYGWKLIDEDFNNHNENIKRSQIITAYNLKSNNVINIKSTSEQTSLDEVNIIQKILDKNKEAKKIYLIFYNIPFDKNKDLLKFISKSEIKIELTYVPSYKENLTFSFPENIYNK